MALYYNIPAQLEQLIQDTKRAASVRNIEEFKEALVVNMNESLKIVIDGNIGRDYSATSTVFKRILFDPKTPEKWETQVSALIDKYR